jgi:hypothetical protein
MSSTISYATSPLKLEGLLVGNIATESNRDLTNDEINLIAGGEVTGSNK